MEEMRQENVRLKKALAEEELKRKKMKGTLDKVREGQVIDRLSAIDAVTIQGPPVGFRSAATSLPTL